jgi:hypothetical protein
MGVAVYPRLDALLRERRISVAELARQLEQLFGLSVDPKTLYRLAASDPVQRADLNIAGAVASVLGVGLDDLFDVRAVRVDLGESEDEILDPIKSQRLADLFDRQSRGILNPAGRDELETLVAEYSGLLHQRSIREFAQRQGISVEQAERETAVDLERALEWWREFESDPSIRERLAATVDGIQSDATE